jgi:hypothetical protein
MDRREGKRVLRRLREARGWSWTDEAAAIRETARLLGMERLAATSTASVRRAIARWESEAPSSTAPDDRYQYVLAHVFAERDGRFDVGPASEFRRLMSALRAHGASVGRLAELEGIIVARAERSRDNPFLRLGQAAKLFDIKQLPEVEESYWALHSRVGKVPFVRSQIALAPFVELCRLLDSDASTAPPIEAHVLAAHCFALAGRLAFELHDDEGMRGYYADALAHARKVPDAWLAASIYTSLAMVTMHRAGDVDEAEQLALGAVHAAQAGSSVSVRARALAVQAEVAARRQLARPAAATLHVAQTHLAAVSPDDPGGNSFDAARFAGFTGLCHLLAGRSREAVDDLESALVGVPAVSAAVQRSIILADLALGYARAPQPQPEASVTWLHECAELIGQTRGRVAMGRIRQVRQVLRPWDGERFLAELDEHMYGAVLT